MQVEKYMMRPSMIECANVEAGKVYVEDRARYEAIAKDWTARYALTYENI